MSSILKALRKLEEEKAASRAGGLDIGRDILRGTVGRRPAKSGLLPAIVLGAVLLLGWGGYVLLAPANVPHPQAPPVAASALPASARPVVVLSRPVAGEPAVLEETIESQEPASFPPTRSRPAPAPKSPPVAAPVQPVQPAPAVPSPQAGPVFILTAIAFNEDAEARLAVINDLPVMIGTTVEDAIVEDIQKDRVRLQRNGKSFEVRLQK